MIDPTPADIGRKVIYREKGDFPSKKIEEGVITSYNHHCVFVRYHDGGASAGTLREDLEWSNDGVRVVSGGYFDTGSRG